MQNTYDTETVTLRNHSKLISLLRIFPLSTKLVIVNADTQFAHNKFEHKISMLLPARAGFFVFAVT